MMIIIFCNNKNNNNNDSLILIFHKYFILFLFGKILNIHTECVCVYVKVQEIRCIIVTWMSTMTKIYKYYRVGYNYNKNFFFHSLFYIIFYAEIFVNDICDEKCVCVVFIMCQFIRNLVMIVIIKNNNQRIHTQMNGKKFNHNFK